MELRSVMKQKPLGKKAKDMRLQVQGRLKSLHAEMCALQQIIKDKEQTVLWLDSPIAYGDIVQEIPYHNRPTRRFVVTQVSALFGWGRMIEEDGTLAADEVGLGGTYLEEPVGRYTGEDLPPAPLPAKLAMEVKESEDGTLE